MTSHEMWRGGLPPHSDCTASALLSSRRASPRHASRAIAARAVFEARRSGALEYFSPVAGMPGFAPALARSLHELRMAGAVPGSIEPVGEGGHDLAALYEAAVAGFGSGGAADRAAVFSAAREVVDSGGSFCERRAVVLVD